jgi:hypothetical protein
MDDKALIDAAKYQLELILSFFPRVESKASVVLAINTGMLGFLVANMPSPEFFQWKMIVAIAPVTLIAISYWYLFRTSFPDLKGGSGSLLYFREVAKRNEANYLDEFRAQSEGAFVTDLLGQAWRNSEILTKKFDYLKSAFVLMLVAVIPWLISAAIFVSRNSQTNKLLGD